MWPNYFSWAKRPSICSHTQMHVGMWDNKKCVHVGGLMHAPLQTAHLHVCMTNARLDIHVGANKAHTVLQLASSEHPNSQKKSTFLILLQGDSSCIRAQIMWDWWTPSSWDYLHFIQSGRCTSTTSSACHSHLSHSPQTSHIPSVLISSEELYFVSSISIHPVRPSVRFHPSAQVSVLVMLF